MTDFGMVPPEINSGRIYAGPGPGSMLSASRAWTELAAELHWAAAAYWSSITALAEGSWRGPSSAAMAAAAAPYVTWLQAGAAAAEQTAGQVTAAAGAYEAALAMSVPPALVAQNRSTLATLVATNVLGQNAPAIAATEALYYEMWAQDATAMYLYAASAAAATAVAPFRMPPQIVSGTDRTAAPTQALSPVSTGTAEAGATQTLSNIPAVLDEMASPTTPTSTLSTLSTLNLLSYPGRFAGYPLNFLSKALGFSKAAAAPAGAIASGAAATAPGLLGGVGPPAGVAAHAGLTGYTPAVSAGMGRARILGPLSVPSNWSATAAPAITPAAVAGHTPGGPTTGGSGIPPVMPVSTASGRAAVAATPRYDMRPTVIPRSPAAG